MLYYFQQIGQGGWFMRRRTMLESSVLWAGVIVLLLIAVIVVPGVGESYARFSDYDPAQHAWWANAAGALVLSLLIYYVLDWLATLPTSMREEENIVLASVA